MCYVEHFEISLVLQQGTIIIIGQIWNGTKTVY